MRWFLKIYLAMLEGMIEGAATRSDLPSSKTPFYSHNLPGSLGMNWSDDDKRKDPEGWSKQKCSG